MRRYFIFGTMLYVNSFPQFCSDYEMGRPRVVQSKHTLTCVGHVYMYVHDRTYMWVFLL